MHSIAFIVIASLVPSLVTCFNATTTFNAYTTQSGVACGSSFQPTETQANGVFSAAINDLSAIWEGTQCAGTRDPSKCTGSGICQDCTGPACDDMQSCGKCYNVKCTGSLEGAEGACTDQTVKVMIVDACPASHPANYCKTTEFGGAIPPEDACQGRNTQFDISTEARSALSTFGGNLFIDVQGPVAC